MKLAVAPSTGRTHRFNEQERRTRCGQTVRVEWRVVDEPAPTCRHCLYPTRSDLDAGRRAIG